LIWLTDPNAWIALATLTALEIVLGIDNIIFISILAAKLPEKNRLTARRWGLVLALVTRIALLFSITWMMRLEEPLFEIMKNAISGRDLILLLGGLFLLGKATIEIHERMDVESAHYGKGMRTAKTMTSVLVQINLLDIVFSLDSVITAVGMVETFSIMVTAVIVAVIFMLLFVNKVSDFVDHNPTIKILALSLLLMIGITLIGESLDFHIPKGYIYFAMAFSVGVEMINLRVRKAEKLKTEIAEGKK